MRLLHGFVMAAAALWCAETPVRADEPLRIAGATIPNVFELGKGGPYEAFFNEVVETGPVRVELVMMPVKRLARSFFEREVDCMYMATDDRNFYIRHGNPVDTLEASKSFSKIYLLAYTRSEDAKVSSWDAFDGRWIAADEGIHSSTIVQQTLPFAKDIHYAKTVDEAFDVLKARRVNIVLAFHIDAEQYFARSGKSEFHADDAFPLITLGEGLACWPSDKASQLVSYLDAQVDKLRKSGELKSRFGFDLRD